MSKKPRKQREAVAKQISKDTSPKVPQRDKINFNLNIRGLDWTEKQKAFIELATSKESNIIFLSGPAGTSKTALAVYCSLLLLNEKRKSEIVYVRSVVESASHSMGYLPGLAEDKLKPYITPLVDKLEEFLCAGDISKLFDDNRIKPAPVNYLRGASYNANIIIVDEAQNLDFKELTTVITRIGKFSKFFILGDPMQSDLKHKEVSGFKPMVDIFNNEESQKQGIFCIEFTKDDIMRSEILKFIIDKIENYNSKKS
jgi:phosphate starvation-inducible PhoH-like protein